MAKKGNREPNNPKPEPARPSAKGKIVIKPKRATTTRLKLSGPITLREGRELAARINSVIAHYNTLYWKTPDGGEILPKINARTGDRRKS